jgi:predicted MPP superfamily phosphohydrolase
MPQPRGLAPFLTACLGAGALIALYAHFVEPVRVQLDRFTLAVDLPGLPAEGLTILHLSDLHCRDHGSVQRVKLERLQGLLANEHYDLVALTGDLIHNMAGLPTALALVQTLHPRLGAFSCLGNRDYWESGFRALYRQVVASPEQQGRPAALAVLRGFYQFVLHVVRNQRATLHVKSNDISALHASLSAYGVQPLVNQTARVRSDGMELWIAGVDDLTQGEPDLDAALAQVPDGAGLILLTHNPDLWLHPLARRAHLILAGHTHGGQIRFPLVGAPYTQGTHLTHSRPAGWFTQGRSHMFVSRGLGESFPFRLAAPPQVALIRLVPAGQEVHV